VLRTGPFTYAVQTDIAPVLAAMRQLYAGAIDSGTPAFADFHLALTSRRRWTAPWQREATLCVDGQTGFDPFPPDMALPYLEWGMNQCVARTAHQYLMMHAAVLERSGAAVILTGPTGSGKSTLCAALAAAGWRLYSDELALIGTASGALTPLGRPISLKNESIELMQRLAPGWRFGPVCEGGRKGRIRHMSPPGGSAPGTSGGGAAPAWLVFVRYAPGSATTCERMEKGPCMLRAIEQCFNYAKLGRTGFRVLADVIERCACLELTYSDTAQAVAAVEALAARSGAGGEA
jgi:HprK-related kinase A